MQHYKNSGLRLSLSTTMSRWVHNSSKLNRHRIVITCYCYCSFCVEHPVVSQNRNKPEEYPPWRYQERREIKSLRYSWNHREEITDFWKLGIHRLWQFLPTCRKSSFGNLRLQTSCQCCWFCQHPNTTEQRKSSIEIFSIAFKEAVDHSRTQTDDFYFSQKQEHSFLAIAWLLQISFSTYLAIASLFPVLWPTDRNQPK